jgi:hypothetical protein
LCSIRNKRGQPLITAYAVRRPDDRWSLLLINKDPSNYLDVDIIVLNTETGKSLPLKYPLQAAQYSSQQYHWVSKKAEGYPSLSLPHSDKIINAGHLVSLPPYSLTIVWETRDE